MDINFVTEQSGRSKLEAVAEAWGFIQSENAAHKKYVTEDQWKQWTTFNTSTSEEFNRVIDEYNGISLTSSQDEFLNRLIHKISSAKRVTEDEFVMKIEEERAAAEAQRIASLDRAAKAKEAQQFKSRLKNMFKRF